MSEELPEAATAAGSAREPMWIAQPLPAPEPPVREAADEPEWRVRLRTGIERSVRRRAARAEERQVLAARRKAGLDARLATRLARLDAAATEPP